MNRELIVTRTVRRKNPTRRLGSEELKPGDSTMRVLHVINGLATGGAETVLYRLTTYPSSIEHEVICLEGRAAFSDRLEAAGIPVHHLNWTSPVSSLQDLVRLYRLIKRSRPDVIQAWMYRSNLLAGIAGKLAGIPVVWNIRSSTLDPLRLATRVLARAGGALTPVLPAAVINCSARSSEIHAKFGYPDAESFVIPNGYNPEEFRPDEEARDRTRATLGIPSGTFLIGTIARWHRQKGFPILLEALQLVRDRGVPVRSLLVGRGMDRDNPDLRSMITSRGLDEHVELLGERADTANLDRALDLHVLASVGSEGFPNVVAETMLSGTPNVTTDVGDARLIVGDTGWLIPAADPQQLAAGIQEAYDEWANAPEEWRKRRDAARERIAENFSIERMVSSYIDVWTEIASDRPMERSLRDDQASATPKRTPQKVQPTKPAKRTPFTVSVVIPLFNKEIPIASTLSSVLAQTRLPDELIVVDDGSTDKSASIAEKVLADADPRIRWRIISQQNAGEGAARNRGAEEATSDYIAFLDADDEWLPGYLAEMEKLAIACPSAGVLAMRFGRRNAHGAIAPSRTPLGDQFFGLLDHPIDTYRRGYGILNSSAVAIRRDAWERCGGFQVGAPTGADIRLWLTLGLTETFAHSGIPLSVWRDEYSAVATRRSVIPEQLRYFLGTDEGRAELDNPDLVRFLSSNIVLQIGVYSLLDNTAIRSDLRRLAKCLPLRQRLKCEAASRVPASCYRLYGWWRRRSRRMKREPLPVHSPNE